MIVLRKSHSINILDDECQRFDLSQSPVVFAIEEIDMVILVTPAALAVPLARVTACKNVCLWKTFVLQTSPGCITLVQVMRSYSSHADSHFSLAQIDSIQAMRNPRSLPPQPAKSETADILVLANSALSSVHGSMRIRNTPFVSIGSGPRYAPIVRCGLITQ
jgi:hypothetical protein